MRLVLGTSGDVVGHRVGEWAAARVPHLFLDGIGGFAAFGIVDETNIIRGAALYHCHAPHYSSIEVSFVLDGPQWLTRRVILGIMAYPFDQLQCERVTAATPRKSASARRFLKAFGFREEGVHPAGFGNFGDAISYGLLRKDWLRSRFRARRLDGQEVHPGPAARA
jgi:RimJ/RimL family protein N-acetyltransferase